VIHGFCVVLLNGINRARVRLGFCVVLLKGIPVRWIAVTIGLSSESARSVERPEDPHQQQHEKTLTTAAGVGVQPEEDVLTLAARAEVALQ
jgi:hypothetical protein